MDWMKLYAKHVASTGSSNASRHCVCHTTTQGVSATPWSSSSARQQTPQRYLKLTRKQVSSKVELGDAVLVDQHPERIVAPHVQWQCAVIFIARQHRLVAKVIRCICCCLCFGVDVQGLDWNVELFHLLGSCAEQAN
jgi:hypothetical protein